MALSVTAVRRKALELCGPTVLVALVVWMLHASLFSGGELVPTHPGTDLHLEFLGWRHFGFTSWLTGHFPFWNPHVFCGIPFFAQIQSCMLYPIAWINLLCNTATATTIEIAANLCIAAICMYAWARQRGTSRCGATLAGAAFTFSGLVYLRVMAGHLTPLATLAWIPLVFLALDRLLSERLLSGMLIGAVAVCLQWLGGHPQLVYYTMLIGGLYVLLLSIGHRQPIRIITACIGMFILGSLLAAVQVIPAMLASKLTLRSGPMSYEFASLFSFPPENLLTLFVPYPLGDALHTPYIGRWYIWETSIYVGILNLALASIALAKMGRQRRRRILALLAAIVILMLGSYTPVYFLLFKFLPGFAIFRDTGKFGMFWVLLLAMLSGEGFDRVRQRYMPWLAAAVIGVGLLCLALGEIFLTSNSASGPAAMLLAVVIRSNSSYIPRLLSQPHFAQMMAPWVACQWFIAGGLMLAAGFFLFARRWVRLAPYVLLALAISEVYVAAWDSSVVSPAQAPTRSQWTPAIDKAAAANQRILFPDSDNYGNSGNLFDFDTLWGYDPAQPRIYSQLIAAAEHEYLPDANQYTPHFSNVSHLFQLLRCRYVLQGRKSNPVIDIPAPMPQLLLVGSYYLLADPQATADLLASSFPFRQSVILDHIPVPLPTDVGTNGKVRIIRQSINDMEIAADLPAPALLLITDAYAPGWNVRAIELNANQNGYQVMRADDVLRAIPLAAGHHHLDVYYVPPGLRAGESLSVAGFILLAAGIGRLIRQRKSLVA